MFPAAVAAFLRTSPREVTMRFKEVLPARPLRRFALAFAAGDELIAGLRAFAAQNELDGAHFTGIGAFSRARVAFWNPQSKDYEEIEIGEQVELLSLVGNVAWSGSERRVHAHVTLGTRTGEARGGHLLEAHVFPTVELFLAEWPEALRRAVDPATALPLLALDS